MKQPRILRGVPRHLLCIAAGLLLSVVLSAAPSLLAVESGRRPNVLLISADDMRFELGAHGSPWVKTPNLDRLAAEGTILLQAHCQYPLCAPSRSSLLTGRRPDSTKVYDVFTRLRTTLPDVVSRYFCVGRIAGLTGIQEYRNTAN